MKKIYPLVALSLLSLALAGCGGSSDPAPAPGPATLSGTAAVGALIANATVTVKDSSSTTADKTTTTSATGSYSVDVSGLTAPYILEVKGGTVNSVALAAPLYSAATAADVKGTINITPLTDLIVANTAQTKASECFTNFTTVIGGSAPSARVTTANLNAAEADLEASLKKILTADGVAVNVDLLRTKFSANSTGLDLALDHLNVNVDPATAKAAVTYIGPDNAAAGVAKGQQFIDAFATLGTNVASTATTYVPVTVGGVTFSAPPAALIRGTAATSGAPVVGGTVTVRDSNAATADITAVTAADGTYSVDVSTLTAPYMLEVKGGTVKGVALAAPLYSAATATDAYGMISVTPLTDAIVAKTTGKTAATAFSAADGSGFSALVTAATLNTSETAMQNALTTGMSGLSYMTSYAIPADFDLMHTAAGTTGVAALLGITTVTVNTNGTGTVTITPPTVNGFTPPAIMINF